MLRILVVALVVLVAAMFLLPRGQRGQPPQTATVLPEARPLTDVRFIDDKSPYVPPVVQGAPPAAPSRPAAPALPTSDPVIQAGLRTNFYQIDVEGRPKAQIAIKFSSRKLEGLPLPKPLYEIFVYSPRVEGVHLRFGKVARGGIRWSDRPQDFRTEVLGLVKAQQVKNAIIVPVGAKGAFVPKKTPAGADRETVLRGTTTLFSG